ncbi:hypothetical protein GH733_001974 [Mirounga leonina]|nr:hypothetical protein GH733_001974 [Mirounga leonina]
MAFKDTEGHLWNQRWRFTKLELLQPTTRTSPDAHQESLRIGECSKTWYHFQVMIHKRLIDLHSPSETGKQITSISIEDVEVTTADI